MTKNKCLSLLQAAVLILVASNATATPFYFSTGDPDGRIGMASRPASGSFGIETADDFVLGQQTSITSATFTGLLTGGAPAIGSVGVEIFRVFPLDSDIGRTSGAPTFGTSLVPTRLNSPADTAYSVRDSGGGTLSFSSTILNPSFTVNNSVQPGGIHPSPNQTTGGDGPVTGMEVEFSIAFTTPLDLAADHYFFVPLVEVTGGTFLWLSAPRPILPPGTLFAPDLQAWTRDDNLAPDWLRVGTDIVGGAPAPTYNATFSLTGNAVSGNVPEPGSLPLMALGLVALIGATRRTILRPRALTS